jgi:hypothetical protein
MARPERFERSTYGLEVRCSIQLSYGRNRVIIPTEQTIENERNTLKMEQARPSEEKSRSLRL